MPPSQKLSFYFSTAALALAHLSAGAAPPPKPQENTCVGEAVVDAHGKLIHTKDIIPHNPHDPMMPASTVKLLTSAMSLEYLPDLNALVTYVRPHEKIKKQGEELCRAASETDDPKRFIKITTTIENLIIAMLMVSDNDAALKLQNLLEKKTGKSFASLAAEYLKPLKLRDSHFFEAAGVSNISVCNRMTDLDHKKTAQKLADGKDKLPEKVNVSTAYDMAVLAQHITKIAKIQEWLKAKTLKLSGITLHKPEKPWNSDPNSFFKTGFTVPAGTALVGTFRNSDKNPIGVALMHCKANFPGEQTTSNQRNERFSKLKLLINQLFKRIKTAGLDNDKPAGNSDHITLATTPKF